MPEIGIGLWVTAFFVLLAAVVRGYSGFGFSAIVVAGGSLVLPAAEIVPMVLMLEVVASVRMLPRVWHDVEWRTLWYLLIGSAFAIPLGQWALAWLPVSTMRLVLYCLVIVACILVAREYRVQAAGGARLYLLTGVVSGIANGIAALGGMVIMLMFLATVSRAAAARATLVAFFLFADAYATMTAWGHGLVNREILVNTLILTVPLFIGIALGQRRYEGSRPESFRKLTIILLVGLSVLGILRTLLL